MRAPRPLLIGLLAAACACAGPTRPAPGPAAPPAPQAQPTAPAPSPATAPRDFFPLAIGNSWTFLDRSPQQPAASHHTVRIVRRDPDGYYVDDQQGALRADDDCLHDRTRRLLCKPIQAGTTWTSVVSADVTERYRITATGETVTVPAGTFAGCARVRSQARVAGVEQVADLTYAPGVGLIRLETFSITGGVATAQVRGELESYRLVAGAK